MSELMPCSELTPRVMYCSTRTQLSPPMQVHSDAAWRMLAPLQIGILDRPNTPPRRVRFRSWEELQRAGVVD